MQSARLVLIGLVVASSVLSAQQHMQVVNSAALPSGVWNKMLQGRAGCGEGGDFVERLTADLGELPHGMVHIAANGAMLGYFDLHRTPGFEKATIEDAALDSEGRIALLVANVTAIDVTERDNEGNPRAARFDLDHTMWVVTVDDNGNPVSRFSFDRNLISGLQFALFRSGNVLVAGSVREGQHRELSRPGAVIFSPRGAILANLKLPFMAERRPQPPVLNPIAGGGDEIFLAHGGKSPFLLKISADGSVGPKVKLAVPEDEEASVTKIAGHRALAYIAQAETKPGVISEMPRWRPEAVFDVETGALVETLLVPSYEMEALCYSESVMSAIRTPEGTLDSLVARSD